MHKIKGNTDDAIRIYKKKQLLYRNLDKAACDSIDDLAKVIGRSRTSIYNAIDYLPYKSTTSRFCCWPTAQAIGKALGWDELDIKQWYNGNL